VDQRRTSEGAAAGNVSGPSTRRESRRRSRQTRDAAGRRTTGNPWRPFTQRAKVIGHARGGRRVNVQHGRERAWGLGGWWFPSHANPLTVFPRHAACRVYKAPFFSFITTTTTTPTAGPAPRRLSTPVVSRHDAPARSRNPRLAISLVGRLVDAHTHYAGARATLATSLSDPPSPAPCEAARSAYHALHLHLSTLHSPPTYPLLDTHLSKSLITQSLSHSASYSASHSASHSVQNTTFDSYPTLHALNHHRPKSQPHHSHNLPIQRPVQIKCRRNQRQVTERLRRVAQLLSRPGYLLRTHSHMVTKAKHVLEDVNPLSQVLFVVRSRLYRVSVP
jgi:hypothetical protein